MKKWLMCVLLITFSICSFSNQAFAGKGVNSLVEKYNVAPDKEWTVTFNTPITEASITDETIYVYDKQTGNHAEIEAELTANGEKLVVKPKVSYEVDHSYVLHISSQLKSVQGELPMIESVELPFNVSKDYQVVELQSTPEEWKLGTSFDSLDEAVAQAKTDGTEGIIHNGTLMWAPAGTQLFSYGFTTLYKNPNFSSDPENSYVNGRAEMEYVKSSEDNIEVRVAGETYYIAHSDAAFVPAPYYERTSYYENVGGDLYHRLYLNGIEASYNYGKAPDNMEEGEKVESVDGNTFKGKTYSFFNDLNLRKQSHYNAEQLNQYLEEAYPERFDMENPLAGLGEAFIKAEQKYHVNALYLMAHAIHESAWGTSAIAQDKNNLYGYKAYDGSAYESAADFESMEECIDFIAKNVLDAEYLNPNNWKYNDGPYLGDKSGGMNIKYASDPFWGQKIAGYMYRADKFLGGFDRKLFEEGYEAVKFPTTEEEEEETDSDEEDTTDEESQDEEQSTDQTTEETTK